MIPAHDVARVRLDNAMLLFDEFVQATLKSPDDATLRGLERRFAERLQIQPSYWSQIKSRSRQIGERLARQFEQCCRKPLGWMDLPHGSNAAARPASAVTAAAAAAAAASRAATPGAAQPAAPAPSQPQDDDERFIVGLVLTYYRRHPQRARTRLLDLLGEVLTPGGPAPPAPVAALTPTPAPRPLAPGVVRRTGPPPAPAPDDDQALWARARQAVAPLQAKGRPSKAGKPGQR